jgi:branched-chain amino acid transport system ATP-binding protein
LARETAQTRAGEAILRVRDLDVFHGTFQALWGVSLEVRRGEMVALIGANTSGKSTLLDAISGFLCPARGAVELDGGSISGLEPWQIVARGITHVPEGRRVFPEMSVAENLVIGSYSRSARPRRRENLEKVYGLFPRLGERRRQVAKTLSGGEQQMLALGRGLMAEPRLMLIDEMSLGLAPVVVDDMFRALGRIRSLGVTILFVEQNVRKSLQHADRAYVLEAGKVALSGTAAELQEEDRVKRAYFGVDACPTVGP